MADKKISELPASSALDLDDFLAVVEDGTTVQATIEDILALSTSSGLPEGYAIPAFTPSVTTDQTTTMDAAIAELPADGGVVLIPEGTFYCKIRATGRPGITFRGVGMTATTIVAPPAASSIVESYPSPRSGLTFEDMTFDMGPNSAGFAMAVYSDDRDTTFRRCGFNVVSSGLALAGAINTTIEDCEFWPDTIAEGNAVNCSFGVRGLRWIRSTSRFMGQGLVFDATPHDDIDVDGGLFDGGWYLLPTRTGGYTNSGGTVTYSSTVLTDSAASFGAIDAPFDVDVRALPVLESGTTGSYHNEDYLEDASATFVTNLVRPGYIVRTATKWAVVDRVASETELYVEGWFDSTTYRPTDAPAAATAYTVHRVLIGSVASNTATTITVYRWVDFHDGASVTPAAGTLYEVLINHGEYTGIHAAASSPGATGAIRRIRVHGGCHITRSWNDQLSIFGIDSRLVVEPSVLIDHGQDYGITSHGDQAWISGTVVHNGAVGIMTTGDDCRVQALASGSPWVNDANDEYLGDILIDGSRTRASGSVVVASGAYARNGFVVAGPRVAGGSVEDVDLTGTSASGYSVAEYKLYSLTTPTVTVTGTILRDVSGTIVEDGASGTITTTSVPDATTTVEGIVELATSTETATGTDTARAVTPAGSAAANHRPIATSGKWVRQAGATFSNAAFSDGDCRIGFIDLPPCTIDRLGFVVATAGGAGAKTRPMAWADNAGVPGVVAIDGGQVDTSSGTGAKNATVSYAHPGGRLWLGLANQGGASPTCNFYFIATSPLQALWDSQPTQSTPISPAIGATITGAPGNNPGTAWNQGGAAFMSVRIA